MWRNRCKKNSTKKINLHIIMKIETHLFLNVVVNVIRFCCQTNKNNYLIVFLVDCKQLIKIHLKIGNQFGFINNNNLRHICSDIRH